MHYTNFKMAPDLKFPPVIVNVHGNHTPKVIKQIVNIAFGGEAVEGVRKCKNGWRKVKFNQENEQRPYLWEEFYRDLNKHGSVWIDSAYEEEYTQPYIAYSMVPLEGYWELRLA